MNLRFLRVSSAPGCGWHRSWIAADSQIATTRRTVSLVAPGSGEGAALIRNAAKVVEEKAGRAQQFGQRLKALLRQALVLAAGRKEMEPRDYETQAEVLSGELTTHLRDRTLRDPDNQRLLNGVGAQHDRNNLLRFLSDEAVEPTNNRAERDLRPAVIARKVSHCSKNQRGARAFEAFTSVLHTIRKVNPYAIVPFWSS